MRGLQRGARRREQLFDRRRLVLLFEAVDDRTALEGDPALVNSDPEGEGWFFKLTLSDTSELDSLMDATAYKAFVDGL